MFLVLDCSHKDVPPNRAVLVGEEYHKELSMVTPTESTAEEPPPIPDTTGTVGGRSISKEHTPSTWSSSIIVRIAVKGDSTVLECMLANTSVDLCGTERVATSTLSVAGELKVELCESRSPKTTLPWLKYRYLVREAPNPWEATSAAETTLCSSLSTSTPLSLAKLMEAML